MLKAIITALITLAAALTICTSADAQDIKDIPEDLQAFITKLHDLSVAKDLKGLEMCVLPYFGMRAYGNSITRPDFEDAINEDYVREFQFESEGMIEVESLKLTEFFFGEYRCFSLLTETPMDKGMLIPEDLRWDNDVLVVWEDSERNYMAFITEEYDNGDAVYYVDFSPFESQHMIVGEIGGNWYLLGFSPYE